MRPILILCAFLFTAAITSETQAQCSGGVCRVAAAPVRAIAPVAAVPVRIVQRVAGVWYPGKLIREGRQQRMAGGGWYAGKFVDRVKPLRRIGKAGRRVVGFAFGRR